MLDPSPLVTTIPCSTPSLNPFPAKRRRRSAKRAALADAFGKPWQLIALEWEERSGFTWGDIAHAWNVAIGNRGHRASFSDRDVANTVRAARDYQASREPERIAAARLVLRALGVEPQQLL